MIVSSLECVIYEKAFGVKLSDIFMYCCSRACYGVLRFVMESGAKGCEVYSGTKPELIFLGDWRFIS